MGLVSSPSKRIQQLQALCFHVRIRLHLGVGDFWGASEVLLVFCERMVFHIPVMMIGVSELNHV